MQVDDENCAMFACLQMVGERFAAEAKPDDKKVLVIFTYGEPNDVDNVRYVQNEFRRLKKAGVLVASCLVSGDAAMQPRRLFRLPKRRTWSDGAGLMHLATSPLADFDIIDTGFRWGEWVLEADCKAFIQVNHPEHVEEFLTLVLQEHPRPTAAPS